MELIVRKRDGREVPFNKQKIINAVLKAFKAVEGEITEYAEAKAENIATYVENEAIKRNKILSIEEIQDMVEHGLMSTKSKDVARAYIEYRHDRDIARDNPLDQPALELIRGENEYLNTENSNKRAEIVTTQRDYLAGILSKYVAKKYIFPKNIIKDHEAGIIHIHDMDYMAQETLNNCCLINLNDMLQNGTVINGVLIEKPHRLITAMTIATQIVSAVASSQYGGCTFTLSHLAPFVRSSFDIYLNKYLEYGLSKEDANKLAEKDLKKEIEDAVQTMNYQLNSFTTTNGQAPFVSVCIYLNEAPEYKKEIAALAAEIFKQRIAGLKNPQGIPVTQAFPKLLYILDENNCDEATPYWWLTKLGAKCTAKRMVPDYVSEKVMIQNKGGCWPSMGCRSSLTPDEFTQKYGNLARAKDYDGKPKYYGRFNIGVCTINLPYVALLSKEQNRDFYETLDYYLEECHKVQKIRAERLSKTKAKVAPILWCYGALARLDPEDTLEPLIHHNYSTSSLGYVGLWETTKVLIGESHTTEKGMKFAKEVLQHLNDKCSEWKKAEDIGYSLYSTPEETTTYKFALALQSRFGIIKDITDKEYVMNSYHVDVKEPIDPFDKLRIEAQYQKLSPGGFISYIETMNLENNIPAILEIIKFIYNNIGYAELNTKSDYCQVCGYDQEIEIKTDENGKHYYKCPNCGNIDTNKMNIARRVCGYISTTVPNQGRMDEFVNRYVHVSDHSINEEEVI